MDRRVRWRVGFLESLESYFEDCPGNEKGWCKSGGGSSIKPKNPRRMYHVSMSSARKSIEDHGLDLDYAMESPWSNFDDYDDGVYLWDNREDAERYAKDLGHDADVWEVDAGDHDIHVDTSGAQKVNNAFFVEDPISNRKVKRVSG